MEYRRIDENTIRCIITEEDMEDYGLDLDSFLSHSEKSDEFLRHIVEEAREELGYNQKHGMVSMRLEVLNDGKISLTFAGGDPEKVRDQMLKHIKSVFPDVDEQVMDKVMEQLGNMSDEERSVKMKELLENSMTHAEAIDQIDTERKTKIVEENRTKKKSTSAKAEKKESFRMYVFSSMQDVMAYCNAVGLKQPVKSHLYKEQKEFYFIVERYRISDYNFNLLTAVAFEFGKVLVEADDKYAYLQEHGDLLIENKAFQIMRKI